MAGKGEGEGGGRTYGGEVEEARKAACGADGLQGCGGAAGIHVPGAMYDDTWSRLYGHNIT